MPNGNILVLCWEYRTYNEAVLAGRDPNYVRGRMLNKVIERESQILMQHNKIKQSVNGNMKPK